MISLRPQAGDFEIARFPMRPADARYTLMRDGYPLYDLGHSR